MLFISVLRGIYAMIAGLATGVMAAAPVGPSGVESMKRHLKYGLKGGLLVALGSNLADLFYIVLIHLGLTQFSSRTERLDNFLWVVCGLVLIGFGIATIKRKPVTFHFQQQENCDNPTPILKCLFSGFFITFSNPATPVIWLGVNSTILRFWKEQDSGYFYMVFAGLLAGMFAGFLLLNLLIRKGKKFLEVKTISKIINILGLLLIGVGFFFSLRGLMSLFL